MTTDPVFKPTQISYTAFANSNELTPVRFRLICRGVVIGIVDTNVQRLLDKRNYDVMTANGQRGQGNLNFKSFDKVDRPSFVDYLRSGWQINLTLAIDYTASNGAPSTP